MEEIKIPKEDLIPQLKKGLEEKFEDLEKVLGKCEIKEIKWTIEGLTVKIQR